MSRHAFGGSVSDWAFTFNSDGSVAQAAGAVLTFWDSITGGSQYTAAPMPGGVDDGTGLLDGTGTPVSSVTCDGNGEIPDSLQGPDGVYKMAADASGAGTGPRRWLFANDIGTDLTTLLAEVSGLPAQAQAPEYVYYDTVQGAYPVRPPAAGVVWWVGPVSPLIDSGAGTGASGSDVWLNTTGATPPGGVSSVTAGDASVVIGGTAAAPTVATAGLDVIAAIHPPAGDWSNNGNRITSLAAGVAGTDAATVGQLSSSAGLLVPTSVKTSAYTAAAGDFVLVSTASAAVTVTLPSAPPDQTRVAVKMVAQSGGNAVTVNAAGSDRFNVAAGATSMILLRAFQTLAMQYQASAALWLVTGTDAALSLDTTSTDIQADGTQSAGVSARIAAADHVHPFPAGAWMPPDNGFLAANLPVYQLTTNSVVVGGTLYLFKIFVRAPFTAASLNLMTTAAAAGTSTGSYAGLWQGVTVGPTTAGTLLTGSADIGSQFASATPTVRVCPFSTPQSLTPAGTGGWVWAGFVFNGFTTMPNLRQAGGGALAAINAGLSASALAACINGTGVTVLANITPASNSQGGSSNPYWAGIT